MGGGGGRGGDEVGGGEGEVEMWGEGEGRWRGGGPSQPPSPPFSVCLHILHHPWQPPLDLSTGFALSPLSPSLSLSLSPQPVVMVKAL